MVAQVAAPGVLVVRAVHVVVLERQQPTRALAVLLLRDRPADAPRHGGWLSVVVAAVVALVGAAAMARVVAAVAMVGRHNQCAALVVVVLVMMLVVVLVMMLVVVMVAMLVLVEGVAAVLVSRPVLVPVLVPMLVPMLVRRVFLRPRVRSREAETEPLGLRQQLELEVRRDERANGGGRGEGLERGARAAHCMAHHAQLAQRARLHEEALCARDGLRTDGGAVEGLRGRRRRRRAVQPAQHE